MADRHGESGHKIDVALALATAALGAAPRKPGAGGHQLYAVAVEVQLAI
jgi:hypothetical protein